MFTQAKVPFDLYHTRGPDDAREAAQKAAGEGYPVVVAIGGDGTINEVVNGLIGTSAVLGALPGGTGNDFTTAIGMPKNMEKAISVLLENRIKHLDLGRVLNRYFVNSVGVGFDGSVAHRKNKGVPFLKGIWVYIYAVLASLATYEPVEVRLTMDGLSLEKKVTLVAVGIGTSYAGGLKIVPDAIMDDGYFDICVFDEEMPWKIACHLPRVFTGSHVRLKGVHMYRARHIAMKLSREVPLHMEGEVLFGDRMDFEMFHKGIPVVGDWKKEGE